MTFTLEVRDDGVAVITLDVVGAALNTFGERFAPELEAIVDRLAREPRAVAAVLTSGKPESFAAGADIRLLQSIETQAEGKRLAQSAHRALDRLTDSTKPVVAAIHGPALGGGFELALACRARVMSDDAKSKVGLPEVRLGVLPAGSGAQRLAALGGLAVALEYGLTGKEMSAEDARTFGVVDEVVPRARLMEASADLARAIAEGRPPARRASRWARVLSERNPVGRRALFWQARRRLAAQSGRHYAAPERIIDVLETFGRKGLAASRAVEANAFAELCVSAGARRAIELFFARAALKKETGVEPLDVHPRPIESIAVLGARGEGNAAADAARRGGYLVKTVSVDDAALETSDLDVRGVDLVVAAVAGDAAFAQRVLRRVEAVAPQSFIFASTSPTLPLRSIAEAARRPERVIGMHYAGVGPRKPLLEVARMPDTAADVVATAVAVGKRQGKVVIVVGDGVGFYTSRLVDGAVAEAQHLLAEGAAPDAIEDALVAWGWPRRSIASFEAPAPSAPERDRLPLREEIQMRCALRLVNEAFHCLGDGVLRSPRDGDVGAVLGIGFPPFRGGPFRYADAVGPAEILARIERYHAAFGARWAPAPALVEHATSGRRLYP